MDCIVYLFYIYSIETTKQNTMTLEQHPKKGQTLSNGYEIVRIVKKRIPMTSSFSYELELLKGNVKRVSNYYPKKKEVSSFVKICSSFSNGMIYKGW